MSPQHHSVSVRGHFFFGQPAHVQITGGSASPYEAAPTSNGETNPATAAVGNLNISGIVLTEDQNILSQ
jgi:hypothetical protein